MDKLTITNVNTNVGKSSGVGVGKNDDIAGLQFVSGNIDAGLIHTDDHTAQGITKRIIDVVDKTGTVKTGRCCAAPEIGSAQILLGSVYNGLSVNAAPIDGAAGVVQGIGTGRCTQRLTKPEESGVIGRCPVFVRNFC